jgi:hypothetical protein
MSDREEEEVRVYRVTGARRAVCGLSNGAMIEVECETSVPAALYGASPLRPMAARVVGVRHYCGGTAARADALFALSEI